MSDKTEEATPKKLKEARKKGTVAKSQDFSQAVSLLMLVAALPWLAGLTLQRLAGSFHHTFKALGIFASGDRVLIQKVLWSSGTDVMVASLPWVLLIAATSASVTFLQVGPLWAWQAVAPDLKRLNPLSGLGQLFSAKKAVELIKNIIKIGLLVWIAWLWCQEVAADAVRMGRFPIQHALQAGGHHVWRLALKVALMTMALGLVDLIYQRSAFKKSQRMSKDEVKREHKESDGDPHTKQARENLKHEILEHNTLEEVRRADVLVVNPTHLAVALKYDREGEQNAPEILAKGQEHLAKRMIEVAEESGVPVMRDIPLARALYELSVGNEIPEALYDAVATVLHVAWKQIEAQKQAEQNPEDVPVAPPPTQNSAYRKKM